MTNWARFVAAAFAALLLPAVAAADTGPMAEAPLPPPYVPPRPLEKPMPPKPLPVKTAQPAKQAAPAPLNAEKAAAPEHAPAAKASASPADAAAPPRRPQPVDKLADVPRPEEKPQPPEETQPPKNTLATPARPARRPWQARRAVPPWYVPERQRFASSGPPNFPPPPYRYYRQYQHYGEPYAYGPSYGPPPYGPGYWR